ncbi:MAG: hypothetical protein QM652_00565 [Legionella sp.]|uniref:hypothetical protein n=1 Tax=Legionella sp. TaxID=459 RepID=UPI0039E63149
MAVSFFNALNPASKNSGIAYPSYVVAEEKLGQEIIDNTVSENIKMSKGASSFYQVFEILVGNHYTFGYL